MMCSLHPLKLIEGPLTLSFNTIIIACHSLSRYPYVCLAIGRCSELLISFNQLISAPSSIAYNAPMWRGVKSFSWNLLFTLIPTFRGPRCSFSPSLCIRPIYYLSFINMTWHTFSDYASKAWLKSMVRWKVTPPQPTITPPSFDRHAASKRHFPLKHNLCPEIL